MEVTSSVSWPGAMHVPDGTEDITEVEGYSWPGEPEDESDCICTPEQRESGGFMGRCPVHGYGSHACTTAG